MGLPVQIDEAIEENFKSMVRQNSFSLGLLIAKKTSHHYCITHLAPLPYQENLENLDEKDNTVNSKDEAIPSKQPKSQKPVSIASVPESIVFMHASQVSRMLPGGLDIVGLYVITPMLELNSSSNQGKIRAMLTTIHKHTSNYFLDTKESSLEKLVLYGCPQSSKIGVKQIDLSEHGTSLISGTLKVQESKWIQLNYNYALSYPIYFAAEKNTQSLRRNVLQSFKPWAQSINSIVILIDGKIVTEDEELHKEDQESPKKGKKKSSVIKTFNLEILENQSGGTFKNISEFQSCSGFASFTGTISGIAYISSQEKMSDLSAAVKEDLIRTLVSRWEMHCDSLVEEPQGSSSEPTLHEPPRRVFLKVKKSDLLLCDYLFPGDTVSDACQSAKELFNVVVHEKDVDDTLETLADIEDLKTPEILTTFREENRYEEITAVKQSNAFQFSIAILVGLCAMVLAYWIIKLR